MNGDEFRKDILKKYDLSDDETGILLEYNRNAFDFENLKKMNGIPLQNEDFAGVWKKYIEESSGNDLFGYMKKKIVQFNFPVISGISSEHYYRDATLSGIPVSEIEPASGLELESPGSLKLFMHQTIAGEIPVLFSENRNDFIALVRAFNCKNEPVEIPDSMGASFVSGYNNWDRINNYRDEWKAGNPDGNWEDEFGNFISKKNLYQDKIIIVSNGPYSGVDAGVIGLSENKWKEYSVRIRIEHEGTHYFTKRCLMSIRNNLLDELIADYSGIVNVLSHFKADWFLLFMGLENFPVYRTGGRFENYIDRNSFTEKMVAVMREIVVKTAFNLEKIDSLYSKKNDMTDGYKFLLCLSSFTLEELSSENSIDLFREKMHDMDLKYFND